MLVRRYSRRTIRSYLYWIRYYIHFHRKAHPKTLGPAQVVAFLTFLAVERRVSAATQAIALNALAYVLRQWAMRRFG